MIKQTVTCDKCGKDVTKSIFFSCSMDSLNASGDTDYIPVSTFELCEECANNIYNDITKKEKQSNELTCSEKNELLNLIEKEYRSICSYLDFLTYSINTTEVSKEDILKPGYIEHLSSMRVSKEELIRKKKLVASIKDKLSLIM